ncbi:MAG: metal-dependent transcriptional regulator, partial [Bacteroidota bacterium]
ARMLDTKASSVTDMLKKLAAKELINYKRYQGVSLTPKGRDAAVGIIRKHRLWEVFLVEKLHFKWDEVHELAEELEHIDSDALIDRLDQFLGHPQFDPHGDPIPTKSGEIDHHKEVLLSDLHIQEKAIIVGVKDSSPGFLQYLEEKGLVLGATIHVDAIETYDQSMRVVINEGEQHAVSLQVSSNLYIKKV